MLLQFSISLSSDSLRRFTRDLEHFGFVLSSLSQTSFWWSISSTLNIAHAGVSFCPTRKGNGKRKTTLTLQNATNARTPIKTHWFSPFLFRMRGIYLILILLIGIGSRRRTLLRLLQTVVRTINIHCATRSLINRVMYTLIIGRGFERKHPMSILAL